MVRQTNEPVSSNKGVRTNNLGLKTHLNVWRVPHALWNTTSKMTLREASCAA